MYKIVLSYLRLDRWLRIAERKLKRHFLQKLNCFASWLNIVLDYSKHLADCLHASNFLLFNFLFQQILKENNSLGNELNSTSVLLISNVSESTTILKQNNAKNRWLLMKWSPCNNGIKITLRVPVIKYYSLHKDKNFNYKFINCSYWWVFFYW